MMQKLDESRYAVVDTNARTTGVASSVWTQARRQLVGMCSVDACNGRQERKGHIQQGVLSSSPGEMFSTISKTVNHDPWELGRLTVHSFAKFA